MIVRFLMYPFVFLKIASYHLVLCKERFACQFSVLGRIRTGGGMPLCGV